MHVAKWWACGRKKAYENRKGASKHAKAIGGSVYKCKFCGKWHATKKPRNKKIKRHRHMRKR